MKKIISLVGLPGSGKTSVGKALRDSFGWFYVDVDEQIEKEAHSKIVDIIREDGEVAFRALESKMISKLISELLEIDSKVVLCPGGGALLSVSNRKKILEQTYVVHIDVSMDVQLERIYKQEMEQVNLTGKNLRPLLGKKLEKSSVRKKLLEIRQQRKDIFSGSDLKISSDNLDANSLASKINNLVTNSF